METVQLPTQTYKLMQEELALLRNSEMLGQINRLLDLLFQEKYGLFMQDYTEDLTAYTVNQAWEKEDTEAWNDL